MEATGNQTMKVDDAVPTDLIHRIASLTHMLRQSMRDLGLDHAIKEAAHAIPDARERLRYVATMTEQAANRVLNAAEAAQPLQEQLRGDAKALDASLIAWFDHPVELNQARDMVDDTRGLLKQVPATAQETQGLLMDISWRRTSRISPARSSHVCWVSFTAIEEELVQVLIDNVPHERREEAQSLLNGPVVNADGKPDVVTSQDQVDDLLASLGF